MIEEAPESSDPPSRNAKRIFVLGGTGTIGRATVSTLAQRGHDVVCLVRRKPGRTEEQKSTGRVTVRLGDVTDPDSIARDGFCGERFDVLVSCLASRTGSPKDAWAVDYQANLNALSAAQTAGVTQMVLLSAICVQKPLLAFQHAKLAFEKALIESGLTYSIVRPTAFLDRKSVCRERV